MDNHYHITITHTYDVGKGFNWNRDLIGRWKVCYNLIQRRYNGKRARLLCDRWGNGYTFYLKGAKVDGAAPEDNIVNDPDVHFVFNVPNKYKAGDGLHISLKDE